MIKEFFCSQLVPLSLGKRLSYPKKRSPLLNILDLQIKVESWDQEKVWSRSPGMSRSCSNSYIPCYAAVLQRAIIMLKIMLVN